MKCDNYLLNLNDDTKIGCCNLLGVNSILNNMLLNIKC
jgi:hypothetical protein